MFGAILYPSSVTPSACHLPPLEGFTREFVGCAASFCAPFSSFVINCRDQCKSKLTKENVGYSFDIGILCLAHFFAAHTSGAAHYKHFNFFPCATREILVPDRHIHLRPSYATSHVARPFSNSNGIETVQDRVTSPKLGEERWLYEGRPAKQPRRHGA